MSFTIEEYKNYVFLLNEELKPAMGCTEPIAIAYASAKAKEVLGKIPDVINVKCNSNIIKNANGVIVPNSDGLKGIKAAAILGVIGGVPKKKLEVLTEVDKDDIKKTKKLL